MIICSTHTHARSQRMSNDSNKFPAQILALLTHQREISLLLLAAIIIVDRTHPLNYRLPAERLAVCEQGFRKSDVIHAPYAHSSHMQIMLSQMIPGTNICY